LRIIILGNSLTYSRPYRKAPFNKLYGVKLKDYLRQFGEHEVFIIGKNANTTRLQSKKSYLCYDVFQFNPDIVVIHLGISDCAPRLFTEIQGLYLKFLPKYIRTKVVKFYSKYRYFFTRIFPKVYVDPIEFRNKFDSLINQILDFGAHPILINILKTNTHLIERSYNILSNIVRYNLIIKELSEKHNIALIDMYLPSKKFSNLLKEDGIHLSAKGNNLLALKLFNLISKQYLI